MPPLQRPAAASGPQEGRFPAFARKGAGTCAAGIEAVPLGGRHVLHSPASGAIATTDALGLAVLADPAAPPAGLPRPVAEAILRAWREAGLFDAARPPFPDPVGDDGRPAPHRCAYATRWGAFCLETDDPVLARQVEEILDPVAAPAQAPGGGGLRCVACCGGGFGVFRDGRALWGRASRDVARYLILREAAEALCGAARVGAVLHGAAVLGPRGALLILGDSGRGKSTLAQGLVDRGCGFLADDHLPLHGDGRRLLAFPTGSAIKDGARGLEEIRRLAARHGGGGSSREGVSYLRLGGAAAAGTAVPLAAIVFPEHAPGAGPPRMAPLAPEAAFAAAIASGSRPARRGNRIAPLVWLFAAVPAHALRYGRSAQSLPACLDLLGA